jgi:signal transduction histidine kinase
VRFQGERILRRNDGSTFDAQLTTSPILDGRGRQVGIVGLSTDISARVQAERRRTAQYAVTRVLAESATLAEAVPAVLREVGTGLGWEIGIFWMVDTDADILRCADVWRASPDRCRLFDELSRRMVFPRGVELCGTVWQKGGVVWSSRLKETLSAPRALVAQREGLGGAVGFPVRSARGVIGVVTFLSGEIPEPDTDLQFMLQAIGSQIGLFTERREAERLETSIGQLRALSRRLVEAREEERARMSREFHDELGQSLTGLKLDLAWVGRQMAGLDRRVPQVEDKVREMTGQVDAVIQTVRQLITEFRPRVLDELGLVAAIEWQTADFRRRSGMPCGLRVEVPELDMDESRRTAVFRILQEILTNVARHAQASEVAVSLRAPGGQLMLEVRDNGRGISESQLNDRGSLGLLGMRERAQACHGTITIVSSPKAGTTVTLSMPLIERSRA